MSRYGGEWGASEPAPRRGRGRRPAAGQPAAGRKRVSRRAKILAWTSVVLVGILVGASLTAYLKVRQVYDRIHHLALTDLGPRPPKYTNAMNILVFGTDKRAGLSFHLQVKLHVGTNQGENNTDTIMIVHISPGRGRVTALSLPRDLMLPAYSCAPSNGGPGQQQNLTAQVQINSLFAIGGPSCLVKTVEQVTGIRIDHFMELGFSGFVNAVNDLGGVNVCLPFAISDANSGLNLSKGPHHINGVTALEFWRTRYSVGNGSDLQRIQRDQYLLSQLLHGILHKGLLSSPTKLYTVIRDVATSLTTDSGMTQSDLLGIARSLSHISRGNVQFVTAPNVPDPVQPAQVVLKDPAAKRLFYAIAHDTTLPPSATHPGRGGAGRAGGKAPQVMAVQPSKVKVTVLNGSGTAGVAGQAATALTSRGFDVLGTGNATSASGAVDYSYTKSVIEYSSPAGLAAADTLKKQLTPVLVREDPALAPGTVDLILGSSFTTLAPAAASTPGASTPGASTPGAGTPGGTAPSVGSLAKSYGGITGNVGCTGDQAAFMGPNSP
jgi:LCP family protein required for cell wall assembly